MSLAADGWCANSRYSPPLLICSLASPLSPHQTQILSFLGGISLIWGASCIWLAGSNLFLFGNTILHSQNVLLFRCCLKSTTSIMLFPLLLEMCQLGPILFANCFAIASTQALQLLMKHPWLMKIGGGRGRWWDWLQPNWPRWGNQGPVIPALPSTVRERCWKLASMFHKLAAAFLAADKKGHWICSSHE